ncbi:MAG TPA: FAD-binding oxidoreductase [Propionibacteriaceae bacterium]|nr:FAD-binding oxidoreductase [Propionibacteriaceae bacterium]
MGINEHDLSRLNSKVQGRVMVPGDDGYDSARALWNAMVDRRPAAVVRCTSSADVAAAIDFARSNDLEIGVRCGGHSVLGISVPDGGMLIDLSGLRSVRVDPDARRAWVQGGALLGDLDQAAQQFGLATTAGNVSHTGVGGLTLGGGMGWLARRFGLACDNVASYEVVTADGATLRVTESQHEDLFWGLRGGGGNFGVVTEFEFRLYEVGTTALLIDNTFDLAEAPQAMRRWRDLLTEGVPEQATPIAWAGTMADAPEVPVELRNRQVASLGFVWVGDTDEGRRLVPRVDSLGVPLTERVEELSYLRLQTVDDEWHSPGLRRRYYKGHYLTELSDEAIDAFLSRGDHDQAADPQRLPYGSFQGYGGAIAATSDDESAFSHRNTLVEFVASTAWTDPAEDEERIAGARRYGAALEPFATGVYVNVLSDEGEAGVRRAYPPNKLARLAVLKRRYDPDNVFHLNQNIRPDASTK